MQLTADAFRSIVSIAESPSIAPGDKRRAPRTVLDVFATLMPFSERFGTENMDVPIRDLSRGGFGFLHDRRLPLGEQFAMLLPNEDGHPIVVLCTVAYWQPLDEGFFAIGARFCRVLRQGNAGLPLILEDAVSGEITDTRVAS
ncbi:MAG TPA: PilZ domain-containing protein [Tepidisphaeraceae bacterium]|jgi:hypothetical protein